MQPLFISKIFVWKVNELACFTHQHLTMLPSNYTSFIAYNTPKDVKHQYQKGTNNIIIGKTEGEVIIFYYLCNKYINGND